MQWQDLALALLDGGDIARVESPDGDVTIQINAAYRTAVEIQRGSDVEGQEGFFVSTLRWDRTGGVDFDQEICGLVSLIEAVNAALAEAARIRAVEVQIEAAMSASMPEGE